MFKRLSLPLCLILALMLPFWPSHAQTPTPPTKLGVHLLLDDGRNQWPLEQWRDHLAHAPRGGYVVQLVRSDDLDPVRWQHFMDLCAAFDLHPILRLATTFNTEQGWWEAPAPDPDGSYSTLARAYADFITALEWPTEAHPITIGNEPNHGNEWGGRPDPAAYARFLLDVAHALHTADPAALVLNAGFDTHAPHTGSIPFADGSRFMDAESFMDGLVAAYPSVFTVLDGWASHAYPLGAFIAPPWEQAMQIDYLNDATNPAHQEPPTDVVNRGINGYTWELWKLSTYGIDPLPVYITETGWRHSQAPYPDTATAALYTELALWGNHGCYPALPDVGWTPLLEDSRVVAVNFFALDGHPAEWSHTNWLDMQADGTIAGTLITIQRTCP